jgi:hypothetical protein
MRTTKPVPPVERNPHAVGVGRRQQDRAEARARLPHEARARLPHERDESPVAGADPSLEPTGPTGVIEQAARDVARGLVDTERRGTPNDLPRPGGKR